jgi:hypothetical protein
MSDQVAMTNKEMLREMWCKMDKVFTALGLCPLHDEKIKNLESDVKDCRGEIKQLETEVYTYIDKQFTLVHKKLDWVINTIYISIGLAVVLAVALGILRKLGVI